MTYWDSTMTYWQLFHFASPVSMLAWRGNAAIAEQLLSEWGWKITQREPVGADALAQFFAYTPEPGNDQEMEHALLSRWRDWNLLALYWSFGSLGEAYGDYPVPIIELTVPAGPNLAQLTDAPDFRLDFMVGHQFYFAFVRNGAIWRDEKMHDGPGAKTGRHLVLQGDEAVRIEYALNLSELPGYGSESRLTFTSHLGQCLQVLGLPIQQWQNQNPDVVNETLDILWLPHSK